MNYPFSLAQLIPRELVPEMFGSIMKPLNYELRFPYNV